MQRCLKFAVGPKDANDEYQCGAVTLITEMAKIKKLKVDTASVLADSGNCCNIESVASRINRGQLRINVAGPGENCDGGTGDVSTDDVLQLTGTTLTLQDAVTFAYH